MKPKLWTRDFTLLISATVLGAVAGRFITFDTTGLDFALTGLFVVLFIEQVKNPQNRMSGVIGLVCSAAALAVFLGVCLYLAALAALYPLARPGDAAGGIAFDGLAAQGNYLGALLCRAAVKAVSCGMWGVAALACSAVIPDMLVTVASPLLFKRLYSVLYNMLGLPQALSIDFVSESLVTVGSWQASLLHACGLFLLYAALAGAAYRLLVKRRLRHG